MRKFLWLVAVVFLALALYFNLSGPGEPSGSLTKVAPDFRLVDLDGEMISLQQLQGKIVLLDFWASWCGPCRISMPVLEGLQREFPQELVLLAINLEEPEFLIRQYVEANRVTSRILMDRDGAVGNTYGATSIPLQVLIDQRGTIHHVQVGFHPSMVEDFRQRIRKLIDS